MNNVSLGGTHGGMTWAYYETTGVGLGGKEGQDGVDGIQANMTNTMNTPIEDIERSLPLLVRRYEFRTDSSGAGQYRGGCGITRTFEMLDETTVTLICERMKNAPWGLRGGHPGAMTRAYVQRGRRRISLPSKATVHLKSGDLFDLNTAGGGGYGTPIRRKREAIEADMENGLITRMYASLHYPRPKRVRYR